MTLWEKGCPADIHANTSERRSHLRAEAAHPRRVAVVLLVAGVSLLGLASGDALASTSLGGRGDDLLRGSPRNEALLGFDGDDELWGLAGDDTLYGGQEDDELYGGSGRDTLLAAAGDDFIEAEDGQRDFVECGAGDDAASVDARDRAALSCETLFGS